MRFSKAFEGSIYSKFLKSGGSIDGHLIYHPDSILPKSALLNVTANILDVPVNVFEMAARVEGVETLMADLFGPDGQFPDNAIVKIFNFTFSAEDKARLRARRSASDNINDNIKRLDEQVWLLLLRLFKIYELANTHRALVSAQIICIHLLSTSDLSYRPSIWQNIWHFS